MLTEIFSGDFNFVRKIVEYYIPEDSVSHMYIYIDTNQEFIDLGNSLYTDLPLLQPQLMNIVCSYIIILTKTWLPSTKYLLGGIATIVRYVGMPSIKICTPFFWTENTIIISILTFALLRHAWLYSIWSSYLYS